MNTQKVKQPVDVLGTGIRSMVFRPIWDHNIPTIPGPPVPYFHSFNKHSFKQKK